MNRPNIGALRYMPELLRIGDLAQVLGYSYATVAKKRSLIARGRVDKNTLPAALEIKGQHPKYRRSEVERWCVQNGLVTEEELLNDEQ